MRKKIPSLLLALVMCIGLAVPAFASDTKGETIAFVSESEWTPDFSVSETVLSDEKFTMPRNNSFCEADVYYVLDGLSVITSVERQNIGDETPELYFSGIQLRTDDATGVEYGWAMSPPMIIFSSIGGNADYYYEHYVDSDIYFLDEVTITRSLLEGYYTPYLYDSYFAIGEFVFRVVDNLALPPSAWAVEQVNAAIGAGLVPEALQAKYTTATTRAEFCALAVALYETATGNEITGRVQFSDTEDVNVEKMASLEVVNGVGDNMFAPSDKLTREQAATMLSRLAKAIGKPLTEQAATFVDIADISTWASAAVGQMQATGIMNGVGDNTFAPKTDYTREQSIITMMRLFDIVK